METDFSHLHFIFYPADVWPWSVPPDCPEVWWCGVGKGNSYERLQHLSWSIWKCIHIPCALSANWGKTRQEHLMCLWDYPFIDASSYSWYHHELWSFIIWGNNLWIIFRSVWKQVSAKFTITSAGSQTSLSSLQIHRMVHILRAAAASYSWQTIIVVWRYEKLVSCFSCSITQQTNYMQCPKMTISGHDTMQFGR
jgi:hypothetical protein